MYIKPWGVRGSIPSPGPDTAGYGGNTACFEIRIPDNNDIFIIDAGSGLRKLGDHIVQNDLKNGPVKAHIFLSHTHWDHIMGFPFFTPIYIPGTQIDVYGPVSYENDTLDDIVGGQLRYRYFPVNQGELAAKITYHQLQECEMEFDNGLKVQTTYLNHPILCLGYRFEWQGKVFCTVYDHEPFRNVFPEDPDDPDYDAFAAEEGKLVADEENKRIMKFYKDADVLFHDSQYTMAEYKNGKQSWGHSTFEQVINSAHQAGVKNVYFFHHDPNRTDGELDKILTFFKKKIHNKTNMKIHIAKEGEELRL